MIVPDPAAAPMRAHKMPFGAEIEPEGGVRFRLWAPAQPQIQLVIEGADDPLPMMVRPGGWHEVIAMAAGPGTLYRFRLDDGTLVPDPASRFQPQDVHGPSEVIDPAAYRWPDQVWSGRPWEEAVIYEAHIGAFTAGGTFATLGERLDHLVDLGVTALELMPVADFPGRRNWGYDGVLPFAPDSAYGRPEDMKALVNAAHARGLMVLLDVVYNHFGPEGNYLHAYAPSFFTERHETPWGAAINFDGADSGPVRAFFIHNALYWLEEFHLDGLRLDAVHAILDDSPKHVLEELAERVRETVGAERHIHLILENGANQARYLERDARGRPRWYVAQWNDDLHHALHVAATDETEGYYQDFTDWPEKLGRSLAEGFAFQGEPSRFANNRPRGEPSADLPPGAFINFIQNHDQIGNRAFGERLTTLAEPSMLRTIASLYLLAPSPPLLFMGEEWAAAEPFPFFCDFGGALADAVRRGRREEFSGFAAFSDPAAREQIPDPAAEETYLTAKLDWTAPLREPHASWLAWYRRILETRRTKITPFLADAPGGEGEWRRLDQEGVAVNWRLGGGKRLSVAANLGGKAIEHADGAMGASIWSEGESDPGSGMLGPVSVVWTLGDD